VILLRGGPEGGGSACCGLTTDGECSGGSDEAMERGFGEDRLRAFRARCRVPRLLCRGRVDLRFRRLAKRLGLRPIREMVQFSSALFDFGEGGYTGAIRGACVLQHGSTISFASGRAGNQRWRAGVAEIAFACMVTEMA